MGHRSFDSPSFFSEPVVVAGFGIVSLGLAMLMRARWPAALLEPAAEPLVAAAAVAATSRGGD